jgi:uncharacterized membrane protein YebE (DUF533 family)
MLLFSTAAAAPVSPEGNQTLLAMGVLVALVAAWLGVLSLVRILRARKAGAATGGRYDAYVLQALVSAAKIDGRVNDSERAAIAQAMTETTGVAIEPAALDAAFANAKLSKGELVAYLADRSGQFSQQQKVGLLKALMAVFVADGRFDEAEHAALIDYTAAVGFDRASAPQMLRGVAGDLRRGNII